MGGSSKKTTTNQTTTSQNTLPTWGTDSLQGLNSRITGLGNVDPSTYVSGPSELQQQSYAKGGLLGGNQGLYGQAAGMVNSGLGANLNGGGASYDASMAHSAGPINASLADYSSVLDNGGISKYMSPYLNDVVNTSLNAYDRGADSQTRALKAQAAGSGAFGDSTYGIAAGQLGADLVNGRAATAAGLLNSGFNSAAGLAQSDASQRQGINLANQSARQGADMFNAGNQQSVNLANQNALNSAGQFNAGNQQQAILANQSSQNDASQRALSGAGLLGNLASAQGDSARADAATQNALGQDQRSITQAQATAPISLAQAMASLYGQNQFGLLGGNTGTMNGTTKETQDPGLLGSIGQAAQGVGSLAALFDPTGAAAKGGSALLGMFK